MCGMVGNSLGQGDLKCRRADPPPAGYQVDCTAKHTICSTQVQRVQRPLVDGAIGIDGAELILLPAGQDLLEAMYLDTLAVGSALADHDRIAGFEFGQDGPALPVRLAG